MRASSAGPCSLVSIRGCNSQLRWPANWAITSRCSPPSAQRAADISVLLAAEAGAAEWINDASAGDRGHTAIGEEPVADDRAIDDLARLSAVFGHQQHQEPVRPLAVLQPVTVWLQDRLDMFEDGFKAARADRRIRQAHPRRASSPELVLDDRIHLVQPSIKAWLVRCPRLRDEVLPRGGLARRPGAARALSGNAASVE